MPEPRDHGLYLKGPMAYEGLLRVGFIVRGRDVPKGKVIDDPISTIDIPATIGDYAGVAMPDARHSRSLRRLIESVHTTSFRPNCRKWGWHDRFGL